MQRLLLAILLSALVVALSVPHAQAVTVGDYQPNIPLPDVYITAVGVNATDISYVELYNNTSAAVDTRGWQICYGLGSSADDSCAATIDRMLLPKDFGLLADDYNDAFVRPLAPNATPVDPAVYVNWVELRDTAGRLIQRIVPERIDTGSWVRRSQTGTYADEMMTTGYVRYADASASHFHKSTQAFSGGWYLPPVYDARIEIVEIVANPRACSPTETALDCADYVKLWVAPAVTQTDLADFAVRSDSGGIKRTASNGADLANYPITDDGYTTVPLSITNGGGYVWIEDMYGTARYEATVVQYPDMSAANKRGYAWALAGSWQWTSTPRPDAANSIYIPPEPVKVTAASSSLTPCREGQERNPATNRCRSIVDAIASLVPCREGQERNPATNRCRNVLAASDSLVSCKEGQERNPETNRCRKITLASSDVPMVADVPSDTRASRTGWIVAGIVVAGALAYGIYEWRDDIRRKILRR